MNQLQFKILSAIIVWATTITGSILSMFITAVKWTSRLESLAGGVFLGAGLAHLLADSFDFISESDIHTSYPIGAAVCLFTFVLFTAVEIFSYGEHDTEFQTHQDDHHEHTHTHEYHTVPNYSVSQMLNTQDEVKKPSVFGNTNSNLTIAVVSLYIIMDIHSSIEGLALGILKNWSGLIAILCAVIGHKPVEAFALAFIILQRKPTKCFFWILILLYTLCSPAAIIIGLYLDKLSGNFVLGLITAFSSGTFMFVGCHEWAEMIEHKTMWDMCEKMWHFFLFALGVIWMLLIAIIEIFGDES